MAKRNTNVEFTDYVGEPYEHRHTDKKGNGDDLYTEKEALALAKADGIEFVDTFKIITIADESVVKEYDTHKKATAALAKLKNKDELTIIQSRHQK